MRSAEEGEQDLHLAELETMTCAGVEEIEALSRLVRQCMLALVKEILGLTRKW